MSGSLSIAAPAPVLQILGTGQLDVEVDDIDLRDVPRHVAAALRTHVGVLPEELQRRRAFAGMDAQRPASVFSLP